MNGWLIKYGLIWTAEFLLLVTEAAILLSFFHTSPRDFWAAPISTKAAGSLSPKPKTCLFFRDPNSLANAYEPSEPRLPSLSSKDSVADNYFQGRFIKETRIILQVVATPERCLKSPRARKSSGFGRGSAHCWGGGDNSRSESCSIKTKNRSISCLLRSIKHFLRPSYAIYSQYTLRMTCSTARCRHLLSLSTAKPATRHLN